MGPNFVLDKGFLAGAAIGQFRAVKFSTKDTVIATAALNEAAMGVCQEEITAEDATNGRVADIRVLGITRAVAGGAIALGARVRATTGGKVVAVSGTAGTVDNVVGVAWLAAAADNDHIDLLLTPGVTVNTAL